MGHERNSSDGNHCHSEYERYRTTHICVSAPVTVTSSRFPYKRYRTNQYDAATIKARVANQNGHSEGPIRVRLFNTLHARLKSVSMLGLSIV
jgi:hypothetical protein